ncbi:uncharacterized protein PRCAT00003400001 [Priceomyces carsonii]|uniref:uncharacterized protein n=1 Tax=Priceomyces carsonii TaxID=28549 RepID=UPI002EDB251A|nr:unnamed protein product [Priceomyces carsonii]
MSGIIDRGARLIFDNDTRDYNHATDSNYKRLRAKADALYKKRNQLSQQSQNAFKRGDKQKAHELSEKSKAILQEAEGYNRQAAEYVFRENNADSAEDEIDLHGLYVKEAEWILQQRIANAIRTNQSHLKVIVGKGLHSSNGIAKLKPAIDQMCNEGHLRHYVDQKNTGVLVIDLTNTHESQVPTQWNAPITQPQQAYHGTSQPQYYQQNNNYGQQYQQQGSNNNDLMRLLMRGICFCIRRNL